MLDPPTTNETLPLRLPAGMVLGRFTVAGWVRDGGMASLYRGEHSITGESVAIKVQLPLGASDPDQRARFDREVDVMIRLGNEPQMVRLHEDGTLTDGRRYLVSDWIEGANLEELLDQLHDDDRNLELQRVVLLGRQLAAGLAAIHHHRIVHRDIKPANIMLVANAKTDAWVKIVDFGVSADLGSGGRDQELTTAGMVIGTEGYMAPEQAAGVGADPSFDVYAFGAVLYEAVTGTRLPPSDWAADVAGSLTKRRRRVPPALTALVVDCLAQNPSLRPKSAAELIERLAWVDLPEAPRSMAPTRSRKEIDALRSNTAARPPSDAQSLATAHAMSAMLRSTSQGGARFDRRWLLILVIPLIGLGAWWGLRQSIKIRSGDWDTTVTTGETATPAADLTDESTSATSGTALHVGGTSWSVAHGIDAGDRADAESTTSDVHNAEDAGSSTNNRSDRRPVHHAMAVSHQTTDTGETSTSQDPAIRDNRYCARIRGMATKAASNARWREVLLHTQDDTACWTERTERAELRVQAFFNLGEHIQCIREGTDLNNRRTKKFVDACRARLHRAGRQ